MSENPVFNLTRQLFGPGVYEVPVKDRLTYTRDDLVRAILAQQWAVAVACMMSAKPGPPYLAAVLANPTLFPCAVDVVEGMEKP